MGKRKKAKHASDPIKRPMSPFRKTHEELASDFRARGIPINIPGFCDHPSFLAVERDNPSYLNHYAAFVAKKTYDPEYLEHAKIIVAKAASLLHKELVDNGRLGACVDISGILGRILDGEGIWNCTIKGSLTVTFPPEAKKESRYFWSVDHGNFIAGHAWIYAPPYTVVDIAVKQQPYDEDEYIYLPETVLSAERKQVMVKVDDIVSPSARAEMLAHGVPPDQHLYIAAQYIPDIFESFPAVSIKGLQGATLKYSPAAVHALDGTFEGMKNMSFNGLTPWELYSSKLRHLIHENA